MKFLTLVAAIAAVTPAALAGLTVNTPSSVTECEPTLITWEDGQQPFYLSFLPPGQPSGTPIKSFSPQTGTSYTWNVDLPANTNFVIALKDSTGDEVYSSTVTVQSGSSTSCVNTAVSETGTGGSSPASTGSGSTPSTSSPAESSVSPSSSGTSTPSGSSASASASASATGSSANGAGRLSVSTAFGVAGIMGLVGAMLF